MLEQYRNCKPCCILNYGQIKGEFYKQPTYSIKLVTFFLFTATAGLNVVLGAHAMHQLARFYKQPTYFIKVLTFFLFTAIAGLNVVFGAHAMHLLASN